MNPLLLGGAGLATLLGGLFGSKGERKTIDPALLERLFGAEAIGKETQGIFNTLRNSPAFSQMMNQAGISGQRVATRSAANLARSGIGASGMGGFLRAAGRGYGGNLQREGQSQLFMQALQAALGTVGSRQNAFVQSQLQQQQQPSFLQGLGGSLSGAGMQGFLSLLSGLDAGGRGGATGTGFGPLNLMKLLAAQR